MDTFDQLTFTIPGLDTRGEKQPTALVQAVARTLDQLKLDGVLVERLAGKAEIAMTAARLAEDMIKAGKLSNADRPLRLVAEVLDDLTSAAAGDGDRAFDQALEAMLGAMTPPVTHDA